jgi:epoxide hydrolase-like predicted phosphatase
MIRAIIFDVGGVLFRTEDHSHRRLLEKKLGLAHGEVEEIVFNSDMGQKAQRGEISDDALWAWVGDRLELGGQLDDFKNDFWAGDVLDEKSIAFIRSLKPVYQTAVISNATDWLDNLLTNLGIADAFDVIIGSAQERIMKPDPAIYKRALDALGRRAEETVFIDDFQINVDGARALGMEAILYRPGMIIEEELENLGVVASDSKENHS